MRQGIGATYRWILGVGLTLTMASPVLGWQTAIEHFITALNSPSVQQELGLREVCRPDRIENRLNVVFQETTPPTHRSKVLSKIGQEFLMILFRERRIPMVTVVELDASGQFRDEVIVSVGASAPTSTSSPRPSAMPMAGTD